MNVGTAMLIAVGLTVVGVCLDAARGTELTRVFSFCYFLGCLGAVLAVRQRGLFFAVVQPPLILFIAVPVAYQFFTEGGGSGIKDILLNVAIPLVNRFPLMLVTSLAVLAVGVYRYVVGREKASDTKSATTRSAGSRRAGTRRARTSSTERPAPRRSSQPRTTRAAAPRRETDTPPPSTRRSRPPLPDLDNLDPPAPRQVRRPPSNPQPPLATHRVRETPANAQPAPTAAYRPAPPRATSSTTARAARSRRAADLPAHPIPNVRYRGER